MKQKELICARCGKTEMRAAVANIRYCLACRKIVTRQIQDNVNRRRREAASYERRVV